MDNFGNEYCVSILRPACWPRLSLDAAISAQTNVKLIAHCCHVLHVYTIGRLAQQAVFTIPAGRMLLVEWWTEEILPSDV